MKVITCLCWRQVDFACSLLQNSDGSGRSLFGCFLHFLAHVAILKKIGWCKPRWEIAHRACQRWESKDPSVQVLHVTKYLNCCVTDDFLPTECLQPEPCFLSLEHLLRISKSSCFRTKCFLKLCIAAFMPGWSVMRVSKFSFRYKIVNLFGLNQILHSICYFC